MRRHGFTLIELLIVVVIISILAMIAIPQFDNTKGKANLAALKSDLRNLASAEESYYYVNGIYTTDIGALNASLSSGVTITVTAADAKGWAAWAEHPQSRPLKCALWIGSNAGAPAYAPVEGRVGCTN